MKGWLNLRVIFFFSHSEQFLRPLFYERIVRLGQSFQVRLVSSPEPTSDGYSTTRLFFLQLVR